MKAYCHRLEGNTENLTYQNLRKGYPIQTTLAKELQTSAGVPEGPCRVEELKQFQNALGSQYQLLVMCRSKPFFVIFKGPDAPNQIRLLKSDHHFDWCTSFPAFVNRTYYCLKCEKGYMLKMSKIIPAKEPSVAPVVKGDYARQECLKGVINAFSLSMETKQRHIASGHIASGKYQKYRKCLKCQAEYTVIEGKRHKYGYAQCRVCKNFSTCSHSQMFHSTSHLVR